MIDNNEAKRDTLQKILDIESQSTDIATILGIFEKAEQENCLNPEIYAFILFLITSSNQLSLINIETQNKVIEIFEKAMKAKEDPNSQASVSYLECRDVNYVNILYILTESPLFPSSRIKIKEICDKAKLHEWSDTAKKEIAKDNYRVIRSKMIQDTTPVSSNVPQVQSPKEIQNATVHSVCQPNRRERARKYGDTPQSRSRFATSERLIQNSADVDNIQHSTDDSTTNARVMTNQRSFANVVKQFTPNSLTPVPYHSTQTDGYVSKNAKLPTNSSVSSIKSTSRNTKNIPASTFSNRNPKAVPITPKGKVQKISVSKSNTTNNLRQNQLESVLTASLETTKTEQEKIDLARAQLTQAALNYGYECNDVVNDNNCFFYAIIDQLLTDQGLSNHPFSESYFDHEFLRRNMVEILEKNREYFFLIMDKNVIADLAKNVSYVGLAGMQAMAHFLKCTIVIIPNVGSPQIIRIKNSIKTLVLGNEVGRHFQSLILINTPECHDLSKKLLHLIEEAPYLIIAEPIVLTEIIPVEQEQSGSDSSYETMTEDEKTDAYQESVTVELAKPNTADESPINQMSPEKKSKKKKKEKQDVTSKKNKVEQNKKTVPNEVETENSIDICEISQEQYITINKKATILDGLYTSCKNQNNFKKAKEWLLEKMAETKNFSATYKIYDYNALHDVCRTLEQFTEAKEAASTAIKLCDALGNSVDEIYLKRWSYHSLSLACEVLNELSNAKDALVEKITLPNTDTVQNKVEDYLWLCQFYTRLEQHDNVKKIISKAIALFATDIGTTVPTEKQAECYGVLCAACWSLHKPNHAIDALIKKIALLNTAPVKNKVIDRLDLFTLYFSSNQHQYKEAKKVISVAISLFNTDIDSDVGTETKVECYHSLYLVCHKLQEWGAAKDALIKKMTLLNANPAKSKIIDSMNLCKLYIGLGQYEEAKKVISIAISLCDTDVYSDVDTEMKVECYHSLYLVCYKLQEWIEAKDALIKKIALLSADPVKNKILDRINLCSLFISFGQYEEAKKIISLAISLFNSDVDSDIDTQMKVKCYDYLSRACIELREWSHAKDAFIKKMDWLGNTNSFQDQVRNHIVLFDLYFRLEQHDKAKEVISIAIGLFEINIDSGVDINTKLQCYYRMYLVCDHLKEWHEVEKVLIKANALSSNQYFYFYLLSLVYRKLDRYSDSVDAAASAVALWAPDERGMEWKDTCDRNLSDSLMMLFSSFMKLNKLEEAEAALSTYLAISSATCPIEMKVQHQLDLSTAYIRRKQYDKAQTQCSNAIKLFALDDDSRVDTAIKAKCYNSLYTASSKLHEWEKAKEATIQEMSLLCTDLKTQLECHLRLGAIYYRTGDLNSAILHYEKGRTFIQEAHSSSKIQAHSYRTLSDCYLQAGIMTSIAEGKSDALISEAINLRVKDNKRTKSFSMLQLYYLRMNMNYALHHTEHVIIDCNDILQTNPQDTVAKLFKSLLANDKQQIDELIPRLKQAYEHNKTNMNAFYYITACLFNEKIEELASVIDITTTHLKHTTAIYDFYYARSMAYDLQGQYIEAIADLDASQAEHIKLHSNPGRLLQSSCRKNIIRRYEKLASIYTKMDHADNQKEEAPLNNECGAREENNKAVPSQCGMFSNVHGVTSETRSYVGVGLGSGQK